MSPADCTTTHQVFWPCNDFFWTNTHIFVYMHSKTHHWPPYLQNLITDKSTQNSRRNNTTYTIHEPLNFAVVNEETDWWVKCIEADLLCITCLVPENYRQVSRLWVSILVKLNTLVQKSKIWLLQLCQNLNGSTKFRWPLHLCVHDVNFNTYWLTDCMSVCLSIYNIM